MFGHSHSEFVNLVTLTVNLCLATLTVNVNLATLTVNVNLATLTVNLCFLVFLGFRFCPLTPGLEPVVPPLEQSWLCHLCPLPTVIYKLVTPQPFPPPG